MFDEEYQDFVNKYWFYEPTEHENMSENKYVTLAIFGETGEIAEKVKKFYRGDTKFVLDREKMLNEVGDLLYYLVRYSYLHKAVLNWEAMTQDLGGRRVIEDLGEAVLVLCQKVGTLVVSVVLEKESHADVLVTFAIVALVDVAKACGGTLQEAANMNIEKLTKRRAGGKMRGEGDER
jgi:NTP pyrophosphatase (non-canonical NTP hydrolase)